MGRKSPIFQSDRTIFLEVHSPKAEAAREAIALKPNPSAIAPP
ncbi:MAG TPA: hypothetical protein V6C90_07415 [Coleofasciculaceae cyanobacterium]